jgi:predicted small integral membrane protein
LAIEVPHLFAAIAVVLAAFAAWDYRRNGNRLSTRGKIWLWLAVVFGMVATIQLI